MEIANDLYSWTTSKRFIADLDTIRSFLEKQADEFFLRLFQADDQHLLGVIPLFDDRHRQQIENALDELESKGEKPDLKLQATIDFVDGRNAYREKQWLEA